MHQVSSSGSNADFCAIYVSSEDSHKSAYLHSLAWAFVTVNVPNPTSVLAKMEILSHLSKQRRLWQVCIFEQSRLSLLHSTWTKSHVLVQRGSWHIYVSREGSGKFANLNSLAWAFFTVHELSLMFWLKNSKWLWSGYTTITNCRQTRGIVRKRGLQQSWDTRKTNKANNQLSLPHRDDWNTK